ncbi:hypothetical protein R1sor_021544 [Riccia sorocarpa]|uniref:Uncharacterized protein n=1 Tax=Riccia sorocarpa TaxID=122646 RepID=A0ABD3GHE0_9MARC
MILLNLTLPYFGRIGSGQGSPAVAKVRQTVANGSPALAKVRQHWPRFASTGQGSPAVAKVRQQWPRFASSGQGSPAVAKVRQQWPSSCRPNLRTPSTRLAHVCFIRKSLNHEKTDKKSAGKFREGWTAIIDLVRNEFMAKQVAQSKEPLYLEAKNAFSDFKAEWDNEKCELVRQREELKEELAKAQELKAQAERREETIRLEKEALEVEYSKEKADWESKNQKLVD